MTAGELRALLPGEAPDDALLETLLAHAESTLLALTHRRTVPPAMRPLQLRLAVIRYNRLGAEGESQRREGSLAVQTEELPDSLMKEIRAFRVARVPG